MTPGDRVYHLTRGAVLTAKRVVLESLSGAGTSEGNDAVVTATLASALIQASAINTDSGLCTDLIALSRNQS